MPARLLDSVWLDGSVLAPSGTARFYAPKTLTQVNVFSDDAATQVVTQPVPFDSNGRTAVPIYTTAPVRMVLFDSTGAQVLDVERVNGDRAELVSVVNTKWSTTNTVNDALTALANTLGGTNGLYASTLAGAVGRLLTSKMGDRISVKDFGAVGNGVADDGAAINAALAATAGAAVELPPGTYLTSVPIAITSANTTLFGYGASSIIKNTAGAGVAIAISNVANVSLLDFAVTHSATSSVYAITQLGTAHLYRGLTIANHANGINGTSGTVLACSVACSNVNGNGFKTATGGDCDYIACTVTGITGANVADIDGSAGNNIKVLGCTLPNVAGQAVACATVSSVIIGNKWTRAGTATDGAILQNSTGSVSAWGNLCPGAVNGSMGTGTSDGSLWVTTSGTATVTVDLTKSSIFKIKMTSSGGTLTVAFTGSAYRETPIMLLLQNTSGGAVTYAFSANIIVSTPGAQPTNGNQITGMFVYDPVANKLVQIGGWSTVIANT